MVSNGQLQLTRLSTVEEFNALKTEWDTLAATQVRTIFLTHDWLSLWWRFYGANYQLWTLVVREGGANKQLVGIVPLMLQHGSGGIRRLMFMGAGEITPNHLDVIAQPDRRADVLRELSVYLCRTTLQWDILELNKLPAEACTAEQLNALLSNQGLVGRIETSAHCPYVELPDSFETYLQTRSASTRKHFRQNRRQLEQDFPDTHLVCAETSQDLNRALDALIRLHQARWTRKGYTGAFSNERFTNFHRAMALRALQTGQLRLYFVQIGAEIAAVEYCYRIADCIQCYLIGFDERWSEYSPGFLIQGYSIEQSIVEGVRRHDFLEGQEQHKGKWATHTRDNVCLRVYAPHWRGKLASVRTQAATRLMDWGVAHVPLKIRRPLWQAVLRLRASRQRVTH